MRVCVRACIRDETVAQMEALIRLNEEKESMLEELRRESSRQAAESSRQAAERVQACGALEREREMWSREREALGARLSKAERAAEEGR